MIEERVLPFAPRPWQVPLLNDAAPRIVAVVHRRAGKSTSLMWRGLARALVPTRRKPPMRVVHVLPLSVQWDRTGLWDQLERAAKSIPGTDIRRSERRVVLPSGGVYQAGGMDNPDSWRGGYADEVIEDEADDVSGDGLDMVIEPMLADHGGTRIYAGTPKGRGRLEKLYTDAAGKPGWSRYLLRWQDTGALSAEAVSRLRSQLSPEEFAQELEVSFSAPNSGSYYASRLDEAERDGRVRRVPWEPKLPVETWWDLGMDDATAVWFVQIAPGGEVRVLEYLEGSGEGLHHYAREIAARPYSYSVHRLPHDVQVRELGTGRSRLETLESLNVRPVRVGRALPVVDGINAVRLLLPRCWFDEEKTALGRRHLRAYRREWIEERQVWSARPVHDGASHAADAFREGAVNMSELPSERQRERRMREAAEPWSPLDWGRG